MSEEIERALDNLKATTMAFTRNLRSVGATRKQIEEVLHQIDREMEEEYGAAVAHAPFTVGASVLSEKC